MWANYLAAQAPLRPYWGAYSTLLRCHRWWEGLPVPFQEPHPHSRPFRPHSSAHLHSCPWSPKIRGWIRQCVQYGLVVFFKSIDILTTVLTENCCRFMHCHFLIRVKICLVSTTILSTVPMCMQSRSSSQNSTASGRKAAYCTNRLMDTCSRIGHQKAWQPVSITFTSRYHCSTSSSTLL